ncbi:hypothetical protein CDR19_20565 [Ectopseudomonas toyotomiensis]|uniref:Uncharacterized protein n=1 Tax=Ectopseudomonas toyotomiensis TaxID=554344 RepID=A0A1I5YDX8_9GAMM|nr:hypothetical protein PSMEN_01380 [Pseudomonas mendocina]PIA68693.1 hypothetical protein CDR19_20565 [Pseudomonas toyotomiensis]SFQ42077.1 hypothetical protein SAMN05216177_113133 [Pseudomonas toyotomiensis]
MLGISMLISIAVALLRFFAMVLCVLMAACLGVLIRSMAFLLIHEGYSATNKPYARKDREYEG